MYEKDDNQQQLTAITTKEALQHRFEQMHKLTREETEVSAELRCERLQKLEDLIDDNRDAIAYMINQDFGHRCTQETLMAEVYPTLDEVRHAKRNVKQWMKPCKVNTNMWFLPATSYLQPQPLGVVGIIAPWNYPLMLSLAPLIGALSAGNRVMIKLSEHTPLFAEWLAKNISEYFDPNEVSIVIGEVDMAQAFSSLPFDHLFFTGSTQVGKHVMRSASEHLTPVTLELGGKSPVIVDQDCDLENTVSRILTGKLLNAGQTCIAPDYVLLPEDLQEQFINLSRDWVEKHYPNLDNNDDYTHLINTAQFTRVTGYLDNAKEQGANVYALTDIQPNADKNLMPPYIVTDLDESCDLLQHEIFAPILPLVSYQGIDNAINYVNSRPRPLALYVFAKDDEICQKVINQTISGGACINDTLYHIAQNELPFGGVGESGMGAYHGKYSFDTFTHYKGIFKQSPLNAMGLLQPPYGGTFDKLMKVIVK